MRYRIAVWFGRALRVNLYGLLALALVTALCLKGYELNEDIVGRSVYLAAGVLCWDLPLLVFGALVVRHRRACGKIMQKPTGVLVFLLAVSCLIATNEVWHRTGVVIGFLLFGVGIIPIGFFAALFSLNPENAGYIAALFASVLFNYCLGWLLRIWGARAAFYQDLRKNDHWTNEEKAKIAYKFEHPGG